MLFKTRTSHIGNLLKNALLICEIVR